MEVAPCIEARIEGIDAYLYDSPSSPDLKRLAFGYGSLYAHSNTPNMDTIHGATYITFYANRDIAAGEELSITYGEDWESGKYTMIGENPGA